MNYSKIYQRFLNLYSAIYNMSEFPDIDPNENYLLIKLNDYWTNNKQITVLEALNMNLKFSRATIHKYIKNLCRKGYLELVTDELDNRFKYISPTELTNSYFNELGKCLIEAASTK